jgi:excisionase family DNA binding protein
MTKHTISPVAGGPKTIAQRYSLGESTVRRAIREGKLKATQVGRRIVVRFDDADRWISKTAAPTSR